MIGVLHISWPCSVCTIWCLMSKNTLITSKQPQVFHYDLWGLRSRLQGATTNTQMNWRLAREVERTGEDNEQKVMELYSRRVLRHPKLSLCPVQSEIMQLTPQHRASHPSCVPFPQWNSTEVSYKVHCCIHVPSFLLGLCDTNIFTEIPKNTMYDTRYCMQTNWVQSHHRYLLLE